MQETQKKKYDGIFLKWLYLTLKIYIYICYTRKLQLNTALMKTKVS